MPEGTATALAGGNSTEMPAAVGWEKNNAGKLGPRVADLAPMMDPIRYSSVTVTFLNF